MSRTPRILDSALPFQPDGAVVSGRPEREEAENVELQLDPKTYTTAGAWNVGHSQLTHTMCVCVLCSQYLPFFLGQHFSLVWSTHRLSWVASRPQGSAYHQFFYAWTMRMCHHARLFDVRLGDPHCTDSAIPLAQGLGVQFSTLRGIPCSNCQKMRTGWRFCFWLCLEHLWDSG